MKRATDYPATFWDRPGSAEDVAKAMSLEFATKLPSGTVSGPLFETQMQIEETEESSSESTNR